MGLLTISTLLLCFYGIKLVPRKADKINADYLSVKNTYAIKGVFVLMVLTGHLSQYVELGRSIMDVPYLLVDGWIAQCIVAPFLFCSGYGIFVSIMNKGKLSYVRRIPKYRFLPALLHFDIALVLFLLMNVALGIHYPLTEYLTALLGWNSVGNSTWYVFATLCLYAVSFAAGSIAFRFFKNSRAQELLFFLFVLVGTGLYICIMSHFKQEVYYNTVLCYPTGILFGIGKSRIDCMLRNIWVWCASVLLLCIGYLLCTLFLHSYYLKAPIFAVLVFVLTSRIVVYNSILEWFGRHIFSIYILQRIPQIVFSHFGFNTNQWLFIICCVPITLIGANVFDKLMRRFDTFCGFN